MAMSKEESAFFLARVQEAAAEFQAEYGDAFTQFRKNAAWLNSRNQPTPQPQIDEDAEMQRVLNEATERRIRWQSEK